MARTLSEIYRQARNLRENKLELTEFAEVSQTTMVDCFKQVGNSLSAISNSSKMSILDAFTWVGAACVWALENLFDVFKVDLAGDLQNRINGTPSYFANALLKYQAGDDLIINEDGTACVYASTDPSKRIVKKVAYSEVEEEVTVVDEGGEEKLMGFHDKRLIFKIATGKQGAYQRIEEEELIKIRDYLGKLLFAGQHATVVSRFGDVLVPKLTVYHDGAVTEDEIYTAIEDKLQDFIASIEFDGVVYVQKIIDSIQKAEHVTDVEIDESAEEEQGVFVAQYDDDNNLIPVAGSGFLSKVNRYFTPNSGYLKESSRGGVEADLPLWRETIVLKVETAKGSARL